MDKVSDQDWELVSAYHDGELDAAATRVVEARLAAEPELLEVLRCVQEMSRGLVALRPELLTSSGDLRPMPAAANANRKPWRWLAGGAIAATILLAVVLGSRALAPQTAADVHLAFVDQPFAVTASDLTRVSAGASSVQPDLVAANLAPVALQDYRGGTVAHYSGRNGCRLSYFRGPEAVEVGGQLQVIDWSTVDGLHHAIVATGMDAGRFEAIADFLKVTTREEAMRSVYAALESATDAAQPCVG